MAMVMVAACKGDEAPKPAAVTAKTVETPAATDPGLAAKPKQRVTIERLGVSLEVPEGTTVSPPRDADSATTSAHLEQGTFMLNLRAVDEYSTPSFLEAQKVSSSDKLVASIRADETPTGWITMKEIESALHEKVVVEVSVRTVVSGTKWDCSVAAPNRAYADLALAACLSLAPATPVDGEPPAGATPSAPVPAKTGSTANPAPKTGARKASASKAERAAVSTSGGAVQGSMDKEVIRRIIRRSTGQFQVCHERGPRTEAKVNVTFVIGGNGKVSAATASGSDGKLSQCVASAFRGLTFPSPADGKPVKVSYPLHFAAAT